MRRFFLEILPTQRVHTTLKLKPPRQPSKEIPNQMERSIILHTSCEQYNTLPGSASLIQRNGKWHIDSKLFRANGYRRRVNYYVPKK